MIVKVCGMRDPQNASDVAALGITMMGFILYPRSARYVGESTPQTDSDIERVGVFVNASTEEILALVRQHSLNFVQLHGSESVEQCRRIKSSGTGIIKAISVASAADIELSSQYEGEVDYLLFDTKCAEHGGSGRQFDWQILDHYRGSTPFLLSGGIDIDSAEDITKITHPAFVGVDLNSRFEIEAAFKDVEKLDRFIKRIK